MPKDDDAIGAVGGDGKVVGDQENRDAVRRGQRPDVIEDPLLHRHVERSRRLVGDDELRHGADRSSDQDALSHAAGKLMRKLPGAERRIGKPDLAQKLDGPPSGLASAQEPMDDERLGDLMADPVQWVEGHHRVLGNPADHAAPGPVERARAERVRSMPSNRMAPPVIIAAGGSMRRIASAIVLFPEPDSPTSATTSPGRTPSVTPRTACTVR